ncbi:HPP family protein [Trypanosoma theileri]|uniref:HPP family protein n=1 Tax=Trypanosoma theileri TaxID=67003 RepID=A0A1X0P8H0_9TRYP|nr:HPP family protein [Trypanosoma theileri]ORC93234.1 HPP family protein [Trypanosoma theileri]
MLRHDTTFLPSLDSPAAGSRLHETLSPDSQLNEPAVFGELATSVPSGKSVSSRGSSSSPVRKFFHLWPPLREFPQWYWSRFNGYDQSKSVYGFYPSWDLVVTFLFVCITMIMFSLIEFYAFHPFMKNLKIFIPAFGASTTVVFCAPLSPSAQPRSLFCSHIAAAIIGVSLSNIFQFVPNESFGFKCAGAVAVGVHLVFMSLTNTMHPPASATCVTAALNPLNTYYNDHGFLFVVFPVISGCVLLFLCAWLMNNLLERRSPYPKYWW